MSNLPEVKLFLKVLKMSNLDSVNKWSKQEHKQLHCLHALVEQLGTSVFVLLQERAAMLGPRTPEG